MLILKRKHQGNNLVKISNKKKSEKKILSTKTALKTLQIGLIYCWSPEQTRHLDKNVNNDDATKW